MATGNTIEAKLRIAAEVAQAIGQLRELRREILSTGDATAKAGAGTGAAGGQAGAATVAARTQEEKTVAAEKRRIERESAAAQRVADREAAAARRAAAREATEALRVQRAAERKAAAERTREEQGMARTVRASANIQKQAYRQLPMQITDITTSIVSGMPVWMVAVQQGGQLRDSFGGIGATVRALLSLLTPLRVAVGGIAAVFGTVAYQAAKGYLETDRLNKALALTGNRAGTSVGEVGKMAQDLAASQKVSIGSVRDTLAALVASGQQTSTTMQATARAITAYRKLTGEGAEEATRLFDGQAQGVLAWAQKSTQAYNFLTAKQLDYIRTLQAQGRQEEAVKFANEELAKTLEQRTVPAIGLVERAWNGVKTAIGAVLDRIKDIGRPDTLEDRLLKLRDRLAEIEAVKANALRRTGGQADAGQRSPEEQAILAEIAALEGLRNADALRRAEKAAADAAARDQALKDSKAYNDALASVDEAGLQQRLQQRLAALDREEAVVRLRREKELTGELETAERLGDIDKLRLQAQAQVVRRQIEIERGRKKETPEQVLASQAAVTNLQAQLVGLEGRIAGAADAAQTALAKDAVQQAAEWERAWKDAAEKIRQFSSQNAIAGAGRTADPAERARLEAQAAVSDERRALQNQRTQLRLRIGLTLDAGQAAELQRQLDRLTREGTKALGETQRRAVFDSLNQQFAEQVEAQRLAEQALADQVQRGQLTTEEAEEKKRAARAESVPQLELILQLLRDIADADNLAEQNTVRGAAQVVRGLTAVRSELSTLARTSAISELTQGLNDITTGAKTAGEALRDMVAGFARTWINVLNQRLAEKMVAQALKALDDMKTSSSGSDGGGYWAAALKFVAGLFHTGGVVGRGMATMSRTVAPAALATMQVLHSGGIAGMGVRPNEQLALLERGEEVLTADDPRHADNFRGGPVVGALNINITVDGAGADAAPDAQRLGRAVDAAVRRVIVDEMRPGGSLAPR